MPNHTDLIYVYELTKDALQNIKDLEISMKKYESSKSKKTRRNYGGKRRKRRRNTRKK